MSERKKVKPISAQDKLGWLRSSTIGFQISEAKDDEFSIKKNLLGITKHSMSRGNLFVIIYIIFVFVLLKEKVPKCYVIMHKNVINYQISYLLEIS